MLSRFRERVAHSSPAIRSLVGIAAQWLPAKMRYGSDFIRTLELIRRAEQSPTWATAEQQEMLRNVLAIAGHVAAAARDQRYAALRTPIEDPELLLRSLPVLQKEDFRHAPEDFLSKPIATMDRVTTSGSSGKPAVFYLDKRRASSEWAYICDSWAASGYQPGEWRAMIRGSHLGGTPPRRYLISKATSEVMLSAMGLDEALAKDFWELIRSKGIVYIHGYPSAISALASAALKSGLRHRDTVKGIFPVSEGMLPHQLELFSEAFPNAAVLPSYGLSERVAMAKYDPAEGTYHFYPLYGYVEILNDVDEPVCVGQRGRIVATGLRLTGMPLVRYDTGDTAELVDLGTGGSPVVREILGRRAQESLITKNGGLISAAALNLHTSAYAEIFAFRIRQSEPGLADVLAVPNEDAKADAVAILASEFERNSLGQIHFTPIVVDALPPTPNGKLRLIDQQVPLPRNIEA